ncbi:hypothetical protein G7Y89_g11696 [Cudoniella acicularis]|uniref:Uncharacterized protein n=1 Tax=Cudoniella acicularis TaxID=354080 RepID=A0A8H4RD92_9HELO|nr:hypothetical protein G7Y89_g11696 [Cudoniella acicularis]
MEFTKRRHSTEEGPEAAGKRQHPDKEEQPQRPCKLSISFKSTSIIRSNSPIPDPRRHETRRPAFDENATKFWEETRRLREQEEKGEDAQAAPTPKPTTELEQAQEEIYQLEEQYGALEEQLKYLQSCVYEPTRLGSVCLNMGFISVKVQRVRGKVSLKAYGNIVHGKLVQGYKSTWESEASFNRRLFEQLCAAIYFRHLCLPKSAKANGACGFCSMLACKERDHAVEALEEKISFKLMRGAEMFLSSLVAKVGEDSLSNATSRGLMVVKSLKLDDIYLVFCTLHPGVDIGSMAKDKRKGGWLEFMTLIAAAFVDHVWRMKTRSGKYDLNTRLEFQTLSVKLDCSGYAPVDEVLVGGALGAAIREWRSTASDVDHESTAAEMEGVSRY